MYTVRSMSDNPLYLLNLPLLQDYNTLEWHLAFGNEALGMDYIILEDDSRFIKSAIYNNFEAIKLEDPHVKA
jgi:hypothetical protein